MIEDMCSFHISSSFCFGSPVRLCRSAEKAIG
jgi:hypothetical protein